MGRISSGVGLVSGINTTQIIDQLMALEAQPKTLLQARIQGMRQVSLDPEVASTAQRIQQMSAGGMGGMRVIPYGTETTLANPDGTIEKITLGGIVTAGQQMMQGVPPLVLKPSTT